MKWEIDENGIPILIFKRTTGHALIKTRDVNGTTRTFSLTTDVERGILRSKRVKIEKPKEQSMGKISARKPKPETSNQE